MSVSTVIGIRPNVGGLYFDAVLKTDHMSTTTITEHPVESGANVGDHSYMEADELSLEVGVSDSTYAPGSFGTGQRSVTAYNELLKLQRRREPFTVVTRLKVYRNMAITSISAPEDFTTANTLKAFIMLREVIFATTETVTISHRPTAVADSGGGASSQPNKTGSTNTGSKQPDASPPQQSILKQSVGNLLGR